MALDFGLLNNIFEHSKEFDAGGGKERIGQGEIIVSLDGTGDFDNLKSATLNLKSGGSIFIKSGDYSQDKTTLSPNSGITIRGNGKDTIIHNSFILNGKTNITIKDLTLSSYDYVNAPIENQGTSDIIIENIKFKLSKNLGFLIFNEGTSTHLLFNNCSIDKNGKTIDCIFASGLTKSIIKNNYMPDTAMFDPNEETITNNIIISNIVYGISFDASGDYNVCIGNQTDVAITDTGTGNEIANNALF